MIKALGITLLICLTVAQKSNFNINEAFNGFMFSALGYCFSDDVEAGKCGWICDRLAKEGYELLKSEDVKKDKITYHIFVNHELKRTASTFSGTRGTS